MANRDSSHDETSVPPVSSLRSKFESLGVQRPNERPISRNATLHDLQGNGLPPAVPRKPPMHQRVVRPKSMMEPTQPELLNAAFSVTRSSFDDREGRNGFTTREDMLVIPRIEQENAVAQNTIASRGRSDQVAMLQKAQPPPKPQVPLKKPTLAARFSEKTPLENTNAAATGVGSVQPQPMQIQSIVQEITPGAPKSRDRMGSDASWVERLRADSDASSHSMSDIFRDRRRSPEKGGHFRSRTSPRRKTRPSRADSNASWVETLNTDESLSATEERPPIQLPQVIKEEQTEEVMPKLPPRPQAEDTADGRQPRVGPGITRQSTFPRTSTHSDFEPPAAQKVQRTNTYNADLPAKPKPPSALSQGFGRPREASSVATSAASSTVSLIAPPAVPAPRRSLDRRKEPPEATTIAPALTQSLARTAVLSKVDSDASLSERNYETANLVFPDISSYNRRPPRQKRKPWQIPTEYDTRLLAVSGDYVCTSGFITRVWDLQTGDQVLNVIHPETFKVTAIAFKPSTVDRIWLGTSNGELHELDVASQRIIDTSQRAHKGREVIKIYAHATQLWTLDASGNLAVWKKGSDGSPSLQSHFQLFNTQKGHNASLVCDGQLWIATGKDVRIYLPTASSESVFNVGRIAMSQMNIGEITSVATLSTEQDTIYFGHTDGKISICHRQDKRCLSTVHVSLNKIGNLYGVGQYLWAGYGTGMMQVYDTSTTPWKTKKEWPAHTKQISSIHCDTSSIRTADILRTVTLGADNMLKIWDGLFEDDFLEERLKQADSSYCEFSEITASVLTWNAGAAKPSHLQHRIEDDSFLREYIDQNAASDILVFGFQELVDLEDKKLTAKSFFKAKKKDAFEQEHMTHQYRAWRDHLTTRVREYTNEDFTNLHTASMIGLFTCIFVKASIRHRIKHVHQAEVKRGMGGHYGNKGALILRIVLDHSSMCFINCHLAAGQTQTSSRNSDAAGILEAECLPAYPLDRTPDIEHTDVFSSGGDGSVILDHELCILNGDLNYRIDTMSRDTVVKHVQQGSLARLLDRDQLLLSRKKNPGFKLRAFHEKQITFSPTYKYNVNSNDYDTSEKRRSPAWCDRILYRGLGKMKCDEYRRWEVRVSDHRPVSASLTCRVKRVDPDRRTKALQRCMKEFKAYKQEMQRLLQDSA